MSFRAALTGMRLYNVYVYVYTIPYTMSTYRAAKTGIAMYSIVYACIDWYKDV